MSKIGRDNREGGDPEGGPIASVHEIDAARGRLPQSRPRRPDGPADPPAPDRETALNMLRTFDSDGVDVLTPDEVLATVEGSAAHAGRAESLKHAAPENRARVVDGSDTHDVDSDEILRELEDHHRRGHDTVPAGAPRGSAQRQPSARRAPSRAARRTGRKETPSGSHRLGRHRRAKLVGAALVPLTIAASTIALSHVGGTAARATDRTRSGRLAVAAEITPFVPRKIFGTLTGLFAAEARRLTRNHTSPVKHDRRKPRSRKPTGSRRVVRQAAAATVVSTTPASSASSSSSSSSAPASSSQPATSQSASTATTQKTQPAFGQNGTLGPGRGAPGTQ